MRRLTRVLTLVLLGALPSQAFAAGTTVYQGGNAATILTPSSTGTYTKQTGGANIRFNPAGGIVSVLGDLTVSQLATPATPTVTPQGTTGATTYGYKVVARTGTGTTAASVEGTTTTGNATLSATNFNRATWAAIDGASGYDVYRTTGGATQGKINAATVTTTVLDDTGLSGSGAAPTTNTTGTFTTTLGGGAPVDAGYWIDAANGSLSAERNLGALTTGLVLNTVTAGVGVPSAYGGTLCTNQFPRSLNASAAATCASVSLTADVTGDLPYANMVQATAASKILVRGSAAGAGDWEEGSLGSGLTMTGTTLSATSGGVTVLNRDVIETEVVNTITETTVYSYSVAGGTLGTNGALRLTLLGDHLNNSGAGVVTTVRVKFGGTTIGGQGPSHTTGASRRALKVVVEIVAANATNAQRASVHLMWGDVVGVAGDLSGMGNDSISGHSSLALDSTAAQTLSVTVEHASAATTISTFARTVILESL